MALRHFCASFIWQGRLRHGPPRFKAKSYGKSFSGALMNFLIFLALVDYRGKIFK